jgi:flagellar hook-length control protein FliK
MIPMDFMFTQMLNAAGPPAPPRAVAKTPPGALENLPVSPKAGQDEGPASFHAVLRDASRAAQRQTPVEKTGSHRRASDGPQHNAQAPERKAAAGVRDAGRAAGKGKHVVRRIPGCRSSAGPKRRGRCDGSPDAASPENAPVPTDGGDGAIDAAGGEAPLAEASVAPIIEGGDETLAVMAAALVDRPAFEAWLRQLLGDSTSAGGETGPILDRLMEVLRSAIPGTDPAPGAPPAEGQMPVASGTQESTAAAVLKQLAALMADPNPEHPDTASAAAEPVDGPEAAPRTAQAAPKEALEAIAAWLRAAPPDGSTNPDPAAPQEPAAKGAALVSDAGGSALVRTPPAESLATGEPGFQPLMSHSAPHVDDGEAAEVLKPQTDKDLRAAGTSKAHGADGIKPEHPAGAARPSEPPTQAGAQAVPPAGTPAEDSDGFERESREKGPAPEPFAVDSQAVDDEASATQRFEVPLRDARGVQPSDNQAAKPDATFSAASDRGTGAAPVRAGVFEQIVQRVAVQVKNDTGEVRIELKPEFLGHVRMQITSENRQFTVRIQTELPAVRDMIESGLQQLKADLQQQGLQVERLEVAVSADPRRQPGRQGPAPSRRKNPPVGALQGLGEAPSALAADAAHALRHGSGRTGVDMFV